MAGCEGPGRTYKTVHTPLWFRRTNPTLSNSVPRKTSVLALAWITKQFPVYNLVLPPVVKEISGQGAAQPGV